jgi:hypothetical protein
VEVQVVDTGRRAPAWFAGVFVAIGLWIMAGTPGLVHTNPTPLPRWVMACFGGLFASGGLLMASLRNPSSLQSLHVKLLAAILFSMFAAFFGWIGFGPGLRPFSTTVAILNGATFGRTSETTGRILFGGFAVLVAVPAILIWWSFAKALMRALRRVPAEGQNLT